MAVFPHRSSTMAPRDDTRRRSLWLSCAAVIAGAILLLWPALLNRYPILCPDTVFYLDNGPIVLRALIHPSSLRSAQYVRSEIYCLSLLLLSWQRSTLGIIASEALVASAVVFLALRAAIGSRSRWLFLAIIILLSAFSSLSWYCSWLMPDVFSGTLCLGLFLLVCTPDSLSRNGRIAVTACTGWSLTAHPTYIWLAVGVCLALLLLHRVSWFATSPASSIARAGLRRAWILIAAVAVVQMLFHLYLYHQPSISGKAVPYVASRLVGDGTAAQTLRRECPTHDWELCHFQGHLPGNDTDFLWRPDGIWQSSSPAAQQRILDQQMPLVLATLRLQPGHQISISLHNAWNLLTDIGIWDFSSSPFLHTIDLAIPGAGALYLRSHEAKGTLPISRTSLVLSSVTTLSWGALLPLAIFAWQRRSARLVSLAVVTISGVVINAVLCGVISGVYPRYETRIAWLLPFTALAMLLGLARPKEEAEVSASSSG